MNDGEFDISALIRKCGTMKILQVISYYNPKFGGDVNVCFHLSKELVKRHHEVTILTTDFGFDSEYADELRAYDVTIIPIPCIANFGLFLFSPAIKSWLENNLKTFEIIHLHNYRSYQNAMVRAYAVKSGIPYILQAHGSVLPFFEKQNLKKIYDFVWGNNILRDASTVIALTQTEEEQYLKMGVPKNKIEIIPNGLDFTRFLHLPVKGEFRSKYNIPANAKMILFLGRIHRIKGIDLLLEAYIKLLKVLPECQLVIVGPDDNYLSTLENQIIKSGITKKPLITGPLFGDEKFSAFVDADVYVLPSHYETFSMGLLEAMYCGTPVIITNNITDFDWIDQHTGFICNRDSEDLKKCLYTILSDKKLRQSFGENGKIIVSERFNFQNVVQSVIDLYYKSTNNTEYRR
jgi:glycosyltransferase involved in cell wall biosynthesis